MRIEDLIHTVRHATPEELEKLRQALESREGYAVEKGWTDLTPEKRAERLKDREEFIRHGD